MNRIKSNVLTISISGLLITASAIHVRKCSYYKSINIINMVWLKATVAYFDKKKKTIKMQ